MRASEIAERALLGALLLEPERHLDVSQWLETADFYAHRHALVYATALDVRRDGAAPTPRAVLDRIMPDPESRRNVDGPFLHTLMESCPHPDRAAVYGRMVLEASIHRRTADRATHLGYVVNADAPADVLFEQLNHELTSWKADADVLQQRWVTAGGEDRSTNIALPLAPLEQGIDANAAEISLVASLLSSPWQYDDIKDWLNADDFARNDAATVYTAIAEVHAQDLPVDVVTVMWAAMRRGELTRDFDHEALSRLAGAGVPGYGIVAAREVLRASLRRSMSQVARQLAVDSTHPRLSASSLMRNAHQQVDELMVASGRWAASACPKQPLSE